MLLAAQELENIINKRAEQTGKTCISSLLSKSYSISSLHKNIIIYLIRKHICMNLRQYFSISLLRDEALSCLVLGNDRFIKEKSE